MLFVVIINSCMQMFKLQLFHQLYIRDAPIPIPVSGIGLDTTFSKVLVLVKSPPIPGTDTTV